MMARRGTFTEALGPSFFTFIAPPERSGGQYSGVARAVREEAASALLTIKKIFSGLPSQSVEVAMKYTE